MSLCVLYTNIIICVRSSFFGSARNIGFHLQSQYQNKHDEWKNMPQLAGFYGIFWIFFPFWKLTASNWLVFLNVTYSSVPYIFLLGFWDFLGIFCFEYYRRCKSGIAQVRHLLRVAQTCGDIFNNHNKNQK